MNAKYEKLINEINLTENKLSNLSQDKLIDFSENLIQTVF